MSHGQALLQCFLVAIGVAMIAFGAFGALAGRVSLIAMGSAFVISGVWLVPLAVAAA